MPKCKSCQFCNIKEKNCQKFDHKLGEKEIYVNVGMCDGYIPTIDYILEEENFKEEDYF